MLWDETEVVQNNSFFSELSRDRRGKTRPEVYTDQVTNPKSMGLTQTKIENLSEVFPRKKDQKKLKVEKPCMSASCLVQGF